MPARAQASSVVAARRVGAHRAPEWQCVCRMAININRINVKKASSSPDIASLVAAQAREKENGNGAARACRAWWPRNFLATRRRPGVSTATSRSWPIVFCWLAAAFRGVRHSWPMACMYWRRHENRRRPMPRAGICRSPSCRSVSGDIARAPCAAAISSSKINMSSCQKARRSAFGELRGGARWLDAECQT